MVLDSVSSSAKLKWTLYLLPFILGVASGLHNGDILGVKMQSLDSVGSRYSGG